MPFADMAQPDWADPQRAWDPTQFLGLQLKVEAPAAFDIWIDHAAFSVP